MICKECPGCGKTFIPSKDQIRANSKIAGPFCSKQCSGRYGTLIQNGSSKTERTQLFKDYFKLDK